MHVTPARVPFFLEPTTQQAYILQMGHRLLLLLLACLCNCTPNADAQSSSKLGSCCPPTASCEKPNEINRGHLSARVVIDDVTFDGPVQLATTNLEPLLPLKQKEYDDDSKWLDDIEDATRSVWADQGYFKAKVSATAVPLGSGDSHKHFSVVIHVDEGPQYRLGSIRFSKTDSDYDIHENSSGVRLIQEKSSAFDHLGPGDPARRPIFPREELRSRFPLQEGDILDAHKVRQGLVALHDLYADNGYIDIMATPIMDVDDEHQLISLQVQLHEQKQYRIGKLAISGLDATTKNALIWKLKSGDIFNSQLFEAFFKDNESLLPAGTSSSNSSEIVRNMKNGTVDISFKFSPCPRP
jgi:outer membrane protein assembly factor BamA